MKKTALTLFSLYAIVVVIAFSCRKTNNPQGSKQSLNQLFAGLRSTPQSLSVQAGRDTIVYGSEGTVLHFYKYSFQDASGNIISSGTVNLQLVEMYKPGDQISNRATTVTTTGQLLQSGGQINIVATMNGQTVYANVYGIAFPQSSASAQKMDLYYGNTNNPDSAVSWTVCDTNKNGSVCITTVGDSDGIFYSYSYYMPPPAPKPWYYAFDSCSSFSFVNCDYFSCAGAVYPTTVTISDTSFNDKNTQVFISLPSDKICLPMYEDMPTHTFSGSIPLGLNYYVVAIANKNGTFYYSMQSGVTAEGLTVNLQMGQDTQGDIEARLAGL